MKKGNGIIIVNYNDGDRCIELIERIRDFSKLQYIIVVDNNSTDKSYEKLKGYENKKIVIIKAKKNGGYGYAINIGAKYLLEKKIKNIFISNPDILFEEDVLEKLVDFLNNNINVGIVAPTIKEKGNFNRGWRNPTPNKDILLNIFGINALGLREKIAKKILYYPKEHYETQYSVVDVVSGCFFVIDSEVLEKIVFFDENVFLYYEENILAKKIQNLKLKTVVLNDVIVKHEHSVTIDKNLNNIKKLKILKESQYYFHKNYNKANILTKGLLLLTNKTTYGLMSLYYRIKKR